MTDEQPAAARLEAMLRRIKPAIALQADGHLRRDMQLDSLDIMELLFEAEKAFRIRIPDEDIAYGQLLVWERLVEYVQAKTSAR